MAKAIRNPIARALRSPHLKPKRFKLAKGRGSYSRKDAKHSRPDAEAR